LPWTFLKIVFAALNFSAAVRSTFILLSIITFHDNFFVRNCQHKRITFPWLPFALTNWIMTAIIMAKNLIKNELTDATVEKCSLIAFSPLLLKNAMQPHFANREISKIASTFLLSKFCNDISINSISSFSFGTGGCEYFGPKTNFLVQDVLNNRFYWFLDHEFLFKAFHRHQCKRDETKN
jgi:hypothetical protein